MARGQKQETFVVTGVVEAKSRAGTGLKVGEDWFNAFTASELKDVEAGDEVEFDYTVTNKGGKDFKNIVEGSVNVTAEGDGQQQRSRNPAPRRSAAPASRATGRASAPAPRAQSAEPDRQRSIVRQNSLTQANSLFASLVRLGVASESSPEDAADTVLLLAREFEKYSMLEDDE